MTLRFATETDTDTKMMYKSLLVDMDTVMDTLTKVLDHGHNFLEGLTLQSLYSLTTVNGFQ